MPTIQAINMSNYGQTSKLNSIPYSSNQVIKTSNVVASLDNWVDIVQTYTFGPTVQARYIATTGGAGSVYYGYSADGINWYASPTVFGSTGQINKIAYNGSIWVMVAGTFNSTMISIGYSFDGISFTAASGTTFGTALNTSAGYGVAWGKDKFVAVGANTTGTSTQTIVYSYDGINWLSAAGTTFNGTGGVGRSVAYNGTRWIAVGTNATTPLVTGLYSTDGITWTATTTNIFASNSGAIGYDVAWSGSRWVAVGTNALSPSNFTVNYSTDGLTWFTTTTNTFNGTGGVGRGVAWNGTKFVAVGQNATSATATIIYSNEGINWFTATNSTTTAFSTTGYCVMWNGTKWIAGGSGTNVMAYSLDGLIWTPISVATFTSVQINYIAYNSKRPNTISFPRNITIAVGYYAAANNSMFYSIDGGFTWTSCVGNVFGTTAASASTTAYCIATNGNMWLVGGTGTASGFLQTMGVSYDGINWVSTQVTANPVFTTNVRGIAWSPVLKLWVAVGAGTNQLAYSYNGITWIAVSGISFGSSQGYCVAWGKDKFVACGGNPGGAAPLTTGNKLYYSYDGITWTVAGSTSTPLSVGVYGIGFNGTIWTCVGNNNGSTALAYSFDGITWTTTASTIFNNVNNTGGAVAWSPSSNRWVAVGGYTSTTQSVAYSNDGITWTAVTVITGGGQGVTWNGNRFVAGFIVSAAAVQIYTSPDGINWTANSGNTFSLSCSALAWSQNLPNVNINQPLIALGSGTNSIAYSPDGIQWRGLGTSIFTTSGYCSCWNGKIWLAGGQSSGSVGVIAYSYDGINWSIATQSLITTLVYGIAWNGTLFVAVGQGTYSIAYSYDGINWLAATTSSGGAIGTGYNVAWGQKYFVAVGTGTTAGGTSTVAYSTDGITWIGLGVTIGGTGATIYGIVCGGNRWVLCGTTVTVFQTFVYYADSPVLAGNWTSATGSAAFPSTATMYSVSYGFYPKTVVGLNTSSLANVFVLGMGAQGSTFRSYYSLDNGVTWTQSTGGNGNADSIFTNALYGITWTGKRFVGVGAASGPAGVTGYSYDGKTWYSSTSPFTTSARGIATSAWPTLGSVYVDNTVTTSNTSGLNTNNQLDIYSDTYFNNGYNNMAVTIKSTQIP